MTKRDKIVIVGFVTASSVFYGGIYISNHFDKKRNLSYNFNDAVQKVHYDIKGVPTITINKNEYCLSAGYNFDHKIEQDDTLIKTKDSEVYFLIKCGTNDTLTFDNGSY